MIVFQTDMSGPSDMLTYILRGCLDSPLKGRSEPSHMWCVMQIYPGLALDHRNVTVGPSEKAWVYYSVDHAFLA